MKPIDYHNLYMLTEEFQQLVGGQLQDVQWQGERGENGCCGLSIRIPGETRWLLFGLNANTPFAVCIKDSQFFPNKTKAQKRLPVENFLRAHFVGRRITAIEIAEKPNRHLRLVFSEGEIASTAAFEFKCFPHLREINLVSEGKRVVFPRHGPASPKGPGESENPSFIEPEKKLGWEQNEELAHQLMPVDEVETKVLDQRERILEKLRGALSKLEKNIKAGAEKDFEALRRLEEEALLVKSGQSKAKLDDIYGEIKKIRRRGLKQGERKNEIHQQIEKAEKGEFTPVSQKVAQTESEGPRKFSGIQIKVNPQWELWVGRDARQNDELIKRGGPEDYWLHLRDYPGAHGLLRGPKKAEPPTDVIYFACCVVADQSQGRKKLFEEGDRLDFIFVKRKFVRKKKGAPPGQVYVEREKIQRIAFKKVRFET